MPTLHKDSHVDHLSQGQLNFILQLFKNQEEPFKITITLPWFVGQAACNLYGPIMGDPVQDFHQMNVIWMRRPGRAYQSRCIVAKPRLVDYVSIIAGPHDGEPCVLYTAFGGPITPKEYGDPSNTEAEQEEADRFWCQHALAIQEKP